ncbi:hypothetical protein [Bowmanella dokdonensis]|uniref:Uncharacterized protein n=1 Tax=Bowmanella dokdonensis TaxID=751969 RepID=A0A939DJV6_9ALTE|nr:hypothetical protein [Bowmanella dokdonensis]MBN7823869.1 hypothetical protein [Bowmanella dokdonensis]
MNNQTLIRNIETLSEGLTPKQLSQFLDIMDAMAALIAKAQENPATPIRNKLPEPTHPPVGVH